MKNVHTRREKQAKDGILWCLGGSPINPLTTTGLFPPLVTFQATVKWRPEVHNRILKLMGYKECVLHLGWDPLVCVDGCFGVEVNTLHDMSK